MVELIMAWVVLLTALGKWEANWFIASGAFAIACQIARLVEVFQNGNQKTAD